MKHNASSYCDYNETFTEYDRLRRPNGMPELLEKLSESSVSLEDQTVLEGGFGTGAYISHLRNHVKRIYGVEGSEEGVRQTLQKCGMADNVHLQLGNILSLAFGDDSFDACMVNQVLHHLDSDPEYPNLNLFLQESGRVLRPGGILTINTSTREQLDPSVGVFWNYAYIETAARVMQSRFIPIDELAARLEHYGFTDITMTIPSGRLFMERYYSDPAVALEPEFLKSDSVYCFLSPAEYEKAGERLVAAIEDGSVDEEMKRAARRRDEIGEAVLVAARYSA